MVSKLRSKPQFLYKSYEIKNIIFRILYLLQKGLYCNFERKNIFCYNKTELFGYANFVRTGNTKEKHVRKRQMYV